MGILWGPESLSHCPVVQDREGRDVRREKRGEVLG